MYIPIDWIRSYMKTTVCCLIIALFDGVLRGLALVEYANFVRFGMAASLSNEIGSNNGSHIDTNTYLDRESQAVTRLSVLCLTSVVSSASYCLIYRLTFRYKLLSNKLIRLQQHDINHRPAVHHTDIKYYGSSDDASSTSGPGFSHESRVQVVDCERLMDTCSCWLTCVVAVIAMLVDDLVPSLIMTVCVIAHVVIVAVLNLMTARKACASPGGRLSHFSGVESPAHDPSSSSVVVVIESTENRKLETQNTVTAMVDNSPGRNTSLSIEQSVNPIYLTKQVHRRKLLLLEGLHCSIINLLYASAFWYKEKSCAASPPINQAICLMPVSFFITYMLIAIINDKIAQFQIAFISIVHIGRYITQHRNLFTEFRRLHGMAENEDVEVQSPGIRGEAFEELSFDLVKPAVISFSNITLTSNSSLVMPGLDELEIPIGSLVGIRCSDSDIKDTIIGLLLGVIHPVAGKVTIGSFNTGDLSQRLLKETFALVCSVPFFVPGASISDLLEHVQRQMFDTDDSTVQDFYRHIQDNSKVELLDFEQKQFLGILRAFVKSPKILIVDETSPDAFSPEAWRLLMMMEQSQRTSLTTVVFSTQLQRTGVDYDRLYSLQADGVRILLDVREGNEQTRRNDSDTRDHSGIFRRSFVSQPDVYQPPPSQPRRHGHSSVNDNRRSGIGSIATVEVVEDTDKTDLNLGASPGSRLGYTWNRIRYILISNTSRISARMTRTIMDTQRILTVTMSDTMLVVVGGASKVIEALVHITFIVLLIERSAISLDILDRGYEVVYGGLALIGTVSIIVGRLAFDLTSSDKIMARMHKITLSHQNTRTFVPDQTESSKSPVSDSIPYEWNIIVRALPNAVLGSLIHTMILVFVTLILSFLSSWCLTLITLSSMIVLMFFMLIVNKLGTWWLHRMVIASDRFDSFITECLANKYTIKLYHLEISVLDRCQRLAANARHGLSINCLLRSVQLGLRRNMLLIFFIVLRWVSVRMFNETACNPTSLQVILIMFHGVIGVRFTATRPLIHGNDRISGGVLRAIETVGRMLDPRAHTVDDDQ